MALKMPTRRIPSRLKNSAKSLGYFVSDVALDYNPVIKELYDNTKSAGTDLYESIRDWKEGSNTSIKNEFTETSKAIFQNFKNDLKTGNWYNKARQDKVINMAAIMGFDESELDFDFDDDDWGDFDSDDIDGSTKVEISEEKKSTRDIINSVDRVGYSVASAVNQGQLASADYVVKSGNANTQALYGLNQKGFSSVTQAIMAVNDSVTTLGKLGQPLTVHMQNAGVFFTKTTEQLDKMQEALDTIVKNTSISTSGGNGSNKATTMSDLLSGGDGVFDFSNYMDMIKTNFKDDKEFIDMVAGAMKGINLKNVSPGVLISRAFAGAVIPKMFKDSMKDFNETLKYFINDTLIKGMYKAQNSTNPLLMFFGDYFAPKGAFGNLKKYDSGKYEKGPIQWDGISKKALVEVIPTMLSKIYSAISGNPETRYDYNAGKFVSMSTLQKEARQNKLRASQNAGGDFREAVMDNIANDSSLQSGNVKQMQREAERFFLQAFESGDPFLLAKLASPQSYRYFEGIDPKLIDRLRMMLKDPKYQKKLQNYTSNAFTVRNDYNNQITSSRVSDGLSNEQALYNDSFFNSRNGDTKGQFKAGFMTDKFGNGLFDYMMQITQDLHFMASAGVYTISESSSEVDRNANKALKLKPLSIRTTKQKKPKNTGELTQAERDRQRNEIDINVLNADIEDLEAEKQSIEEKRDRKNIKESIVQYFEDKGGIFKGIMAAPIEAATSLLNKLTNAMTQVIIGDPNDPESGLFGRIATKAKDLFESVKEKIKDMFDPDKANNVWDKIFGEKGSDGKRHGGFFSEFFNETKTSLRGGFDYVKQTAKEVAFGKNVSARDKYNAQLEEKNKKLSELQQNRSLKEEERKLIEQRIAELQGQNGSGSGLVRRYNRFPRIFGGASEATKPLSEMTLSEATAYLQQINGELVDFDSKSKELESEKAKIKYKKKESAYRAGKNQESGLFNIIYSQGRDLATNIKTMNQTMVGDQDPDKVQADSSTLIEDLKKGKGNIGAGALVGMGAGALVGAPLLGAIAGAGIGFVKSSSTAQDWLFGKQDEDGNRKGGLLGDNFNKEFAETAKKAGAGAAIGGGIGLFLGSPVLGAIVGGSIGYVKKSEKAQNFLFGKLNEDGTRDDTGVLPAEITNWFKKNKSAAALMGTGAGIGALFAGPFGAVGGLAIGAGINYFNTSEEFRKKLFGDGKEGGILGDFKRDILDNIKERIKNQGHAISGWLRNTGRNLLDTFKKGIKEKVFGNIGKFIRNRIEKSKNGEGGGLIGLAGRAGQAIYGKAKDTLSNRADKRLAKNLEKGYLTYNKDLGRDMTSAEIFNLLDENNKDDRAKRIQTILGNKGDLDNIRKEYAKIGGAKTEEERGDVRKDLVERMNNEKDLKKKNMLRGLIAQIDKDSEIAKNEETRKKDSPTNEEQGDQIIDITESIKDNTEASKDFVENIRDFVADIRESLKNKMSDEDVDSLSDIEVLENSMDDKKTMKKKAKENKKINKREKREAKKRKKQENQEESLGEEMNDVLNDESASGWFSRFRRIRGRGTDDEDNMPKFKFESTMFGMQKLVWNSKEKEYEPDKTDDQTDETSKTKDTFMNSIKQLPVIGSAIGGLTGLLGKLKGLGGDDEGGEKKKSFFESLLDFLNPNSADSGWGKLANFLSSGKFGVGVGNIMGFAGLASIGLAIGGLSGKLNDITNKLVKKVDKDDNATSHGRLNSGSKTVTLEDGTQKEIKIDPVTGKAVTDDEGNYVDYQGNSISPDEVKSISSTQNRSLSHNMWKNTALQTARNVAKGKTGLEAIGGVAKGMISKGGKLVKKSASIKGTKLNKLVTGAKKLGKGAAKVGKGIAKVGKKAGKGLSKLGSKVANSKVGTTIAKNAKKVGEKVASTKLGEKVIEVCTNLVKTLKKVFSKKGVSVGASKIDDLMASVGKSLSKKVDDIAVKAGLSGATDLIPVIGQIIYVVDLVVTGTNAWGDAENILGIVEEATTGEKIVATLIATLNEAIPVVGGLIPHDIMASIIIGAMEAIGLFPDQIAALREKQAQAKEIVDEYNKANGTDYTIEEYNINVNENVKNGWWTETKHAVKSGFDTAVNSVKSWWGNTFGGKKEESTNESTSTETTGSGSRLRRSYRRNNITPMRKPYSLARISGGATSIQSKAGTGYISSPLTQIGSAVKSKIAGSPVGQAVNSIFNMVTENFDQDNMLGAVGLNKQDMVNFAEQIKSLSKAASEGDLKSIAQQGLKFTGQMAKSPLSKFFSIAYKMAKSFNSIGGVFGNIASPVSEVTTEVAEKAQTIGDKVKNVAKDTWDKLKEGAKSFWAGIFGNNDSTSGSGSNLRRVRGGASGFVSQFDPRYSNIGMVGGNFADKGCGPAVASMISGGNLSVNDAVNMSRLYQNSDGVSMEYFRDVLASQGLSGKVIGGSSKLSNGIMSSLANGEQVIIAGRDSSNSSKDRSPFGPNTHYVLATGMDRHGNIMVNDPELDGPTVYNSSILNGAKAAVSASGSKAKKKYPRLFGGRSVEGTTTSSNDTTGTGQNATSNSSSNSYEAVSRILNAMKSGETGDSGPGFYFNMNGKDGTTWNYGIASFTKEYAMDGLMSFLKSRYPELANKLVGAVGSTEFNNSWAALGQSDTQAFGDAQMQYLLEHNIVEPANKVKENFGADLLNGNYTEGFFSIFNSANNWSPAFYSKNGTKYGTGYKNYFKSGMSNDEAIAGVYNTLIDHTNALNNPTYDKGWRARWEREKTTALSLNNLFKYDGGVISNPGTYNSTGDSSLYNSSTGSTDSSDGSSSTSGLGIIQKVLNAFSTGFSKLFGGSEDTSTSTDGSTDSTSTDGSNGTTDTTSSYNGATTPEGKGNRDSVLEIARSQIGYQEKASNSQLDDPQANVGSNNWTKYGNLTGANGAAWCASFVSWVFDQAYNHDTNKRNKALRGGITAAVSQYWNQFKGNMDMHPQPGDVIIYKNGTSHTGIVESVDETNQTFNSIEGNTSGNNGFERDGGQVARKENRPWNYSAVTGFGHPDWDGASAAGSGLSRRLMNAKVPDHTNKQLSRGAVQLRHYSGGDSDLTSQATNMLNNIGNAAKVSASNGKISQEVVAKLLETITKLLQSVSNNTAPIQKIYDTLQNYSGGASVSNTTETQTQQVENSAKIANANEAEASQDFKELVGILAELAKG